MFTTTKNVTATAASTGVGGPVAAFVPSTFQIITTPVNISSLSSSSSSSSSSSTISPAWRLTSTSSSTPSIIKQPAVVSIINANMNVTSSTSSSMNTTGVTLPSTGTVYYISTSTSQPHHTLTTGNLILQSPQTLGLVSARIQPSLSTPTFTRTNNSNTTIFNNPRQILTPPNSSSSSSNNFKPGICIDTPILGRLAPITIQRQITANSPVQDIEVSTITITTTTENEKPDSINEQSNSNDSCIVSNDDNNLVNDSQDQEIEIFVKNVVCSFSLCCNLDLRKIAKQSINVIYQRDRAMVLMKLRNPYCAANIWSSGKVIVTGTTSEDDALRGARRIARLVQRLGFKVKFRHFRVVNCLAICSMPWPIDIVKLSRTYPEYASYEPEMNPGATVRLSGKAVFKVFTTGSMTVIAPNIERINTSVNEFYPQLFECRKVDDIEEQC